jgi:hypothetical protein
MSGDERSWRLTGDPVRVDIGPPIFPGCAVDAVPVNELRRVKQQLQGAVATRDALAKLVRVEYPAGMPLHEIAATWGDGITADELAALKAWGQ